MRLVDRYKDRKAYSISLFTDEVQVLRQRQKEMINNNFRYRCFVGYRGVGMTTGLVYDLLYRALNKPNQNICLMSNTTLSSRIMLYDIKEKVKDSLITTSRTDEIVFVNGSKIRTYPAKEQVLRGGKFDHVYIDNAISIKENRLLNTVYLCTHCVGKITVCATVESRFPFPLLDGTLLDSVMGSPNFDLSIFQNEEEQYMFDLLMARVI